MNSGRYRASTSSSLGPIERVAAAAQVLVVDAVQLAPVRRAVDEALRIDGHRMQHDLVGDRVVAVEALAHRHAFERDSITVAKPHTGMQPVAASPVGKKLQ